MASQMDEEPADREFTLNTGTVLALFLALALICAVFFGFGYTMGRKSAQTAVADSPAAPASSDTGRPTAGSPTAQPVPGYQSQEQGDESDRSAEVQSYKPSPAAAAQPLPQPKAPSAAHPLPPAPTAEQHGPQTAAAASAPPVQKPAPIVRTTPTAVPTSSLAAQLGTGTAAPGSLMYVQVAAVSHHEDADVLLSALHRRGYTVVARNDPNDHLIHVQIGPFSTRKDADAMRQKLLGDGYNAIVK